MLAREVDQENTHQDREQPLPRYARQGQNHSKPNQQITDEVSQDAENNLHDWVAINRPAARG